MRTSSKDGKLPLPGGAVLRLFVMAGVLCLVSVTREIAASEQPSTVVEALEPLEVEEGASKNHRIDLDFLKEGVVYTAKFERSKWEEGGLELFFYEHEAPRTTLSEIKVSKGKPLLIRLKAERCCPAMKGSTRIRLQPDQESVSPVALRVTVAVEEEFFACEGRVAMAVLLFALTIALVLYLHSMFAHSHFLTPKRLAQRLQPLVWSGYKTVDDAKRVDIDQLVERELRFWRRAGNWLRANPLIFGLPGRAYHETVELILAPQRDGSRLSLMPFRDLYQLTEKRPDRFVGRLFAGAGSDIRFFGVLQTGSFNGLKPKGVVAKGPEPRRVDLRRGDRLLHPSDLRKSRPSEWRIGWEV